MTAAPQAVDLIARDFPLAPVETVPEIRLHQAGPKSGLWRLEAMGHEKTPYWAYVWGGGLALARHVLDNPDIVAGRRVLDLGAGSGLAAIAAVKAGAAHVIAADIDPFAISAVGLNAAANDVELSTHLGDLTAGAPPLVDLVMVSDLYYDKSVARRVTPFLDGCLASGAQILVGDPGRAWLPMERLRRVATYPGPDFATRQTDGTQVNTVFGFGQPVSV